MYYPTSLTSLFLKHFESGDMSLQLSPHHFFATWPAILYFLDTVESLFVMDQCV